MRLPQGKGLFAFFFNRTSQSILPKVKNGRHKFLLQKALPAPRHTALGYSFVALVSILMTSLPARECKDFCTLTDHLLYSVTHCSSQRLLSSNCVKASSSVTALIPSATLPNSLTHRNHAAMMLAQAPFVIYSTVTSRSFG